jgi:cellulose synthase/poly-beta-1,6-N-acetylglucosamine synthase-like glycosyltransferase
VRLGTVTTLLWILAACWLAITLRDLWSLRALTAPPLPCDREEIRPGSVTVVIATRNESDSLPASVAAWAGQQGVEGQIVVVDDQSDDNTQNTLQQLAVTYPSLRHVRIDKLPAGWLGKTWALQCGAADITTDWVLFSDTDARPHQDLLARVLAGVSSTEADHAVVLPTHRGTSFLGRACLLAFHQAVQSRLALIRTKKQRSFVGVGAFNLLRTSAYRNILGHRRLQLEVLDDVYLGYLLYRRGYRSTVWFAPDLLSIRWGETPCRLLGVLEKNMFAVLRYRTWIALPLALALLAATLLPILGLVQGSTAGAFAFASWALSSLPAIQLARRMDWERSSGALVPWTRGWLAVSLLRSIWTTLRRQGVHWRGRHYALDDLRAAAANLAAAERSGRRT